MMELIEYLVTDEWFDNDHPNPLHPIGVIIDPIKRRVEVTTYYYVDDIFFKEEQK